MKTVCLIGSFRFYKDMLNIQKKLISSGVPCFVPQPSDYRDADDPSKFLPSSHEQPKEMVLRDAHESTIRCFGKIDECNIIYVVNRGGYVGKSTLLDFGYAYAKKKPIHALEAVDDFAVLSLIKEVVSSDRLIEMAKEG